MERATPVQTPEKSEPLDKDPRWELVQRVASSASFLKSRRLREFLLFVCERALREPDNVVREQEIGVVVFGRPIDFDPSEDTLVRVQASQLRKRLQQYFAAEGANEPVTIEIPKGTYMPAFRERAAAAPETKPEEPAAGTPRNVDRTLVGTVALCLILALSCAWLLSQNRKLHDRLYGHDARPTVDAVWRQMFGERHTYVVLGDGTLTMWQDLLHLQLTPTQYQRQQFKMLAAEQLSDPVKLDFTTRLMNRQFTPIADVGLLHRVTRLHITHGIPMELVFARNAGTQHFKSHNAVLSGTRRSNPWVDLFEQRLNFRSRFDEDARVAYLDNLAPQPGEQPSYKVAWDRMGYCRVAYLPNLDSNGSVLIISGTDFSSTDAGAEFITSERWVRQLLTTLGTSPGQPLPHFEVLLKAQLVLGAAPSFELIAHRRIQG